MSNALPRTRRAQFSVRALLILMLLVGAGLGIYRWPWVVEQQVSPKSLVLQLPALRDMYNREFPGGWEPPYYVSQWGTRYPPLLEPEPDNRPDFRQRTTYCRGWKGSTVKHGLEQIWLANGRLLAERQYVEGDLRKVTLFSEQNDDVEATSFENGRIHGKYFCRLGPRTWEGQFRAGKRTGVWQTTLRDGNETITARQQYQADKAHGDWTWTVAGGKVLQSAQFELGRLVLWNGRSVHDELARWSERQQLDAPTRELFALPAKTLKDRDNGTVISDYFDLSPATKTWTLNAQQRLRLHAPRPEEDYGFLDLLLISAADEQPIGETIVQQALVTSRIVSSRFGLLCVVPICESELNWRDRTGVMEVSFKKPSWQAASWDELRCGSMGGEYNVHHKQWRCCEWELAAIFKDTGIEIDVSRLPVEPEPKRRGDLYTEKRHRREIVGLLLAGRGWSCKQQGNELIIHPHPAQE